MRRCLLADTNWRWRGCTVSISNTKHKYSHIDWLINPLIGRTDETDGGTHQYDSIHQDALPDQYINREADTPIGGHKSRGDGYGLCLFSIIDIYIHLLIHRLINWSINGQKNGRREKYLVQQTSRLIIWLIYQQRLGDPYRRIQIDRHAVSISNSRH